MPRIFDHPYTPRLRTVLDEVRSGAICISDFHDRVTWSDQQRLVLLDSIARGMPIGSFLVWRTRTQKLRTGRALSGFELSGQQEKQPPWTYLLDGYQRLATLLIAFSWTDRPDLLRKCGISWPTYYNLEAGPSDMAFTFFVEKRQPPIRLLPLYTLSDSGRLFEFQKVLRDQNMEEEANRAERLANQFMDYPIPIVPLVSEDLNTVLTCAARIR